MVRSGFVSVNLIGGNGERKSINVLVHGNCKQFRVSKSLHVFNLSIGSLAPPQVREQFITRRVFKTQHKGLGEEHNLFQPFYPQMDVRDLERLRKYEQALVHFERQEYVDTLQKLVDIEVEGTSDSAAEFLMQRTRDAIKTKPTGQIKIASDRL